MKPLKTLCLLAPLIGACGEPQGMVPQTVVCAPGAQASYDGTLFTTNAATELEVKARFKAFLQPMKDAELSILLKPTAADLGRLLDTGSPSLRTQTNTRYAQTINDALVEFEAAAGLQWQPGPTPMGPGGIYGKYIFNGRGTDLRQIIEKGMFGAMFYHQAQVLLGGPLTLATIDRVLALFGAPPSFPGDDKAMPSPDDLVAVYAERRDKKDTSQPGLYGQIKAAFLKTRTAVAAGDSCTGEAREGAQAILKGWEQVLAATSIYYLNDAAKRLGGATRTENELAAGLHGYGEAVGFLAGLQTVPENARILKNAQADDLLNTLLAKPGAVGAYQLVSDGATHVPRLSMAIATLAAIYNFTPQQVEEFKTNY